jgi:hypothetical protein
MTELCEQRQDVWGTGWSVRQQEIGKREEE